MTSRSRFTWLGLLFLLAVGLVVMTWRPSSDETPAPTTDRTSTSGGTGERLTLHGALSPPAPAPSATDQPAATRSAPNAAVPWPPSPRLAPATPKMVVRGRVLEHDGTPARQASIAVWPLLGPSGLELGHGVGLRATGLGDGRFEVDCQPSTKLQIDVCSERSMPRRLERHVAAADVVDLGDLRLEAGATLEGRVLFGGQANPFGPVDVWVTPARGAANSGVMVSERRSVTFGQDALSILSVNTSTDATGAWRVEGLTPGAYRVLLAGVEELYFHEALLPAQTRDVTAPGSPVELDLDVSLLRVRATPDASPFGVDFERLDVTDAAGRLMSVTQGRRHGHRERWGADADTRCLLVPANVALDVRVQCAGHAAWARRVQSTAAGGVLEVTAPVERTTAGRLVVTLPAAPLRANPRVRYTLFEPGTRHVVYTGEALLRAEPPPEASPPTGTWDLELSLLNAAPGSEARHGLPQRQSVTIAPGAPAQVLWQPPLGALLRLQVDAHTRDRVRCHLCAPGARGQELWFFPVHDLPAALQEQFTPFRSPLRTGSPFESAEPLAPGPVTLRLDAEGFEPHEQRLVLEAGEVHDLRIRLVPR
jgi:protocatechuate 3,4-dioxygenase beta subunit